MGEAVGAGSWNENVNTFRSFEVLVVFFLVKLGYMPT